MPRHAERPRIRGCSRHRLKGLRGVSKTTIIMGLWFVAGVVTAMVWFAFHVSLECLFEMLGKVKG